MIRSIASNLLALLLCVATISSADEPQREGMWLTQRSDNGILLSATELTLHPQPEPKPALTYQLIPDEFNSVEGNSAIYYLKALGFLEQNGARELLQQTWTRAQKLAQEKGIDVATVPPYSWLKAAPSDLPVKEVREYLALTSFQPPYLAEAAKRRSFSLDRNLRDVESPISVLLPEIQTLRELARNQSLRCRLAIAENRFDDAITILGQQFALANHLGKDEFLVSALVGLAISSIAWEDTLHLIQCDTAPNLYWAVASLPKPLANLQRALASEKQLLLQQVKSLQEVDETLRPAGYWQDFIDRILPALRTIEFPGLGGGTDADVERTAFVALIAAAYPGAKRFLLEDCKMNPAKVDAYPTAQVVFLAMRKFYEQARDDQFKWFEVPFAVAQRSSEFATLDKKLEARSNQIGWAGKPATLLLPAVTAMRGAQQRELQRSALLQTIESIRMFGANNAGKLPTSLDTLPYPAPVDPATGEPFTYEFKDDHAILASQPIASLQYRFTLRFAH